MNEENKQTMTVNQVADLCQTTPRTVRRWIIKHNNQPGQNVQLPGQNVQLIDIADGVETRLNLEQVLSVASIGRGKVFSLLLKENLNNQKALAVASNIPNQEATNIINQDVIKALSVINAKVEDLQRSQTRLLGIEGSKATDVNDNLKKYIDEKIKDYSADIFCKIDDLDNDLVKKMASNIDLSNIWREPAKYSKDQFAIIIKKLVIDYSELNNIPIKATYGMLYATFGKQNRTNLYMLKNVEGDSKQSFLDFILSKFGKQGGVDLISILSDMLGDAPF